ncbi:MAG TPA: GNAT family N-acetyltransferase [Ktedonobacteraceae bacterium]
MTIDLTIGIQVRAPRKDEITAVFELLQACDVNDCGIVDTPLENLQSEWRDERFNLARDAWVAVTPGERLVGYAALDHGGSTRIRFYGRVHPDYRGQGIGSRLLALVEERTRGFMSQAEADTRIFLQTWCHGTSQSSKDLLEASGYACVRHTWAMSIEMPTAPLEPAWPAGITLRPFMPERDARAVFDAKEESFRDHWGYLPRDFDHWYQRNITSDEKLDPSLWFIAMDGEQVAGIALCGYYFEAGEVNILGVRRAWRRSGLGLALLHHAFGEFYQRGARKVTLGVDAESLTGATRLYERAGMSIELVYDAYEKTLREGVDLSTRQLEDNG